MSVFKKLFLSILIGNATILPAFTQDLSNDPQIPYLPQKGSSIKNFVPEKWKIKYKITENLNTDNVPDVILVLEIKGGEYVDVSTEQANELESSKELPRLLIILFKTKTGYSLSAVSRKLIACEHCGGVRGDPFDGISIKDRTFTSKFYAGSAWRGKINHQFKYLNNNWYLKSRSVYNFNLLGFDNETRYSKIDYLDHTFYRKTGKGKDAKVQKKKLKNVSLITLSDFDITNNDHYWGTKEEE